MKERYKPIFAQEHDSLLDIAQELDAKCAELTEERDQLLRIIVKANKVMVASLLAMKTNAKNLPRIFSILKTRIDSYYQTIQEALDGCEPSKNCSDKDCKK